MTKSLALLGKPLYSLRLEKHAILAQCHGLVSQVWLIIDKKNINIYDVK